MCESICPVDAIRYDDEVPQDETVFVKLNEDAFRGPDGSILSPGGWKKGQPALSDPTGLGAFKVTNRESGNNS